MKINKSIEINQSKINMRALVRCCSFECKQRDRYEQNEIVSFTPVLITADNCYVGPSVINTL